MNTANGLTVSVSSKCGILNLEDYRKGEVLHSYLYRIAQRNGFISVDDFLKNVQNIEVRNYQDRVYATTYDCSSNFTDTLEFEDNFDWLRYGTLYSVLQAFSPVPPEVRLREYTRRVLFKDKSSRFEPLISELYSCPECRREEGEDWYYHIEHQMPYLTFCPKHKVRLERLVKPRYAEYSEHIQFESVPETSFDELLSEYAWAIYNGDFQCTASSIVGALNTKFKGMYSRVSVLPRISERVPLLEHITYPEMVDFDQNRTPLPLLSCIPFIAYLFDSPDEFMCAVGSGQSHQEKFLKAVNGKFEMLTEYRNDAVMVRCLDCGAVFYVYPQAFIKNPVCYKEHK